MVATAEQDMQTQVWLLDGRLMQTGGYVAKITQHGGV